MAVRSSERNRRAYVSIQDRELRYLQIKRKVHQPVPLVPQKGHEGVSTEVYDQFCGKARRQKGIHIPLLSVGGYKQIPARNMRVNASSN